MLVSVIGLLMNATTMDTNLRYAYGANTGWMDAGDPVNGLIIRQSYCSGYIYSANTGWINCGDGNPTDLVQYANTGATDFGINHDGFGNLSGMAYGSNTGWIVFEQSYGLPKVDLETGELSGYAWSANTGWIDLEYLATITIFPGPDTDFDNIPDWWELSIAGDLLTLGTSDHDGDGCLDQDEFEGNTDPFDNTSYTRIISIANDGINDWVTWTISPNRVYILESSTSLDLGSQWSAVSPPFIPGDGSQISEVVNGPLDPKRFYRVKVYLPLSM